MTKRNREALTQRKRVTLMMTAIKWTMTVIVLVITWYYHLWVVLLLVIIANYTRELEQRIRNRHEADIYLAGLFDKTHDKTFDKSTANHEVE